MFLDIYHNDSGDRICLGFANLAVAFSTQHSAHGEYSRSSENPDQLLHSHCCHGDAGASGKFVTLFYGVLDASSRILQYTNAGHLRPILIGSNGKVKHLENGGALLGVFPDWKYENSTVELGPGDILLLFTDGITEAMDLDGEEFGEERLIQAARNPVEQSIEDLQGHLLNSVKEFCNFRMRDDATLILLAACRVGPEQRKPALINFQDKATKFAGVTP